MRKRSSVKTTAPVRSCSCWAYVLLPAQGSPQIKWAVDILIGTECYTTDGNADSLRPHLWIGRTHLIVIGTPVIDDVTSTHWPLILTTSVPATLPVLSDGPLTRTPTSLPEITSGTPVGAVGSRRDCAHKPTVTTTRITVTRARVDLRTNMASSLKESLAPVNIGDG